MFCFLSPISCVALLSFCAPEQLPPNVVHWGGKSNLSVLHGEGESKLGRDGFGDGLQLVIGDGHVGLDDCEGVAAPVVGGGYDILDVYASQRESLADCGYHTGAVSIAQHDGVAA